MRNKFSDTQYDSEVVTDFYLVESSYSTRKTLFEWRQKMYSGDHWEGEPASDTEFQLVFNYVRSVALRYASMLGGIRAPTPDVPANVPSNDAAMEMLRKNERFLLAMWSDFLSSWSDVEVDASRFGVGVIQILWSPDPDQPETITIGKGEAATKSKRYTKNPFIYRAIDPRDFYPVYRTFRNANDFETVYRRDRGRLRKDVEREFNVNLSPELTADGRQITAVDDTVDLIERWTRETYDLYAVFDVSAAMGTIRNDVVSMGVRVSSGPNTYGCFPFWVLQNIRADPHENPMGLGTLSDIDEIIGINKHYDELMSEMAEEVVGKIHSPLVYKSDDHQNDPNQLKYEPGAVFPIGEEEELDPLSPGATPPTFLEHMKRIYSSIQDLSFLGQAGFGEVAANVSGQGFGIALTPLQQIVELKLTTRIPVLRSICAFLLKQAKKRLKDSKFSGYVSSAFKSAGLVTIAPEDIESYEIAEISYGPLLPRDEIAHTQNEFYKFKTGGQSLYTTLKNVGVADPLAEIQRIKEEAQDAILNPDKVMVIVQAKQMAQQAGATQPPSGMAPEGPPQPQGQNGLPVGGGGMMGQPPGPGNLQQLPKNSLPGTAQPGVSPVNMMTTGGMMNAAPPVPTAGANQLPQGVGAGNVTPFLQRGTAPNLSQLNRPGAPVQRPAPNKR